MKADCDNGYFKVANALGDALCRTKLSDQEHRVLFAVMRRTFGFNQAFDWISLDQICEMTGIKKPNVSKTLKVLLGRNILKKEGKKLGVNPVISEWEGKAKIIQTDNERYAYRQSQGLSKQITEVIPTDNPIIQTDNEHYADRQPQKKTLIQKTLLKTETAEKPPKKKSSSPQVDFSVFGQITPEQVSELKRIRKANKGGAITQRVANQLAKEFQLARQHGFSLDDCLTEWETRGWKSFKAEWVAPKHGGQRTQPNYPDFHSGDTSWADGLILE